MGVDREGRVLVEKHRLGREAAGEGEQKVSGTRFPSPHALVISFAIRSYWIPGSWPKYSEAVIWGNSRCERGDMA